jgi:hypothetical protein
MNDVLTEDQKTLLRRYWGLQTEIMMLKRDSGSAIISLLASGLSVRALGLLLGKSGSGISQISQKARSEAISEG